MDTMVNRLLDVDRQAKQILEEARQYHDKTLEELEQEKKRILGEYTEKANRHIEDARASDNTDADDAVGAIRQRYAALTEKLEALYAAEHAGWEYELLRRCKEM